MTREEKVQRVLSANKITEQVLQEVSEVPSKIVIHDKYIWYAWNFAETMHKDYWEIFVGEVLQVTKVDEVMITNDGRLLVLKVLISDGIREEYKVNINLRKAQTKFIDYLRETEDEADEPYDSVDLANYIDAIRGSNSFAELRESVKYVWEDGEEIFNRIIAELLDS